MRAARIPTTAHSVSAPLSSVRHDFYLMQSRIEYVNLSGLRVDGRRPKEVRQLRCKMGVLPRVDGSAMVEQGNTVAIAVVHGPREARRRADAEHDQGFLTCNVSIAPFASTERRKRRAGDRKLLEASTALQQCFETAVQTRLYPRSQIEIHVQVLQSDGGLMAGGWCCNRRGYC